MTKEKEKRPYQSPKLMAVSFQVESGFTTSNNSNSIQLYNKLENNNQQPMEDYSTVNGWTSGSNQFWE